MPIYERPASYSQISFGANLCSNAVITYLWAGNELEQPTQVLEVFQAIRIPAGKTGKLSLLQITAGAGPTVAASLFTVRKRSPGTGGGGAGSPTLLSASLAPGATLSQQNTNEIDILDGDEISIQHSPGLGQLAGPATFVVAVLSLRIE